MKNKRQGRKKRRLYLIVSSLVILGFAAGLILMALEDSISLFMDPTEVKEQNIPPGQNFTLGGLVEVGSLVKSDSDLVADFVVTDGQSRLKVTYKGLLPDLFREGQGVVTEGSLNGAGVFVADIVLAKHDENYMPKEVIASLKKRGEWQRETAE